MKSELFDFKGYREYLAHEFPGKGPTRGRRTRLAEMIRCQTSFISQVITFRAHLNLEHAMQASEFLHHTSLERDYFMLLVQRDRAGSKSLKNYFTDAIEKMQTQRNQIKTRIQFEATLSEADQMTYYSAWYFSVAHILSALPGMNTIETMAHRLKLEVLHLKSVLDFLEERKLIRKEKNEFRIGPARIHLEKGSPMLPRHHTNWRMKAIDAVNQEKTHDLHYSAILGIAKKDQERFKERLLKLLEEFEPVVRDSKEEIPVALLFDLFEL